MKKTCFLYDDRYLLHDTGEYHPESHLRLKAIFAGIEKAGLLDQLYVISAEYPQRKWVEAVHDRYYITRFEEASLSGQQMFGSADNTMCPDTYDTAMLAVGGILSTARLVMEGTCKNAFCAVRPPGHHAELNEAMGFCYFNNIAIAARFIQDEYKIKKVGIVDFDVHHGNGTQHLFERDPSVFYYSIHQHPTFAYPGTGREFEYGRGPGDGFTKNSPVLPGQGDKEYKALIEKDLIPAFGSFAPEVILVSTGFDAHENDDMSDINLTTDGYSWIMEQVVDLGAKYASGRVISILEGGYCLDRLGELAANHVRILMNQ